MKHTFNDKTYDEFVSSFRKENPGLTYTNTLMYKLINL